MFITEMAHKMFYGMTQTVFLYQFIKIKYFHLLEVKETGIKNNILNIPVNTGSNSTNFEVLLIILLYQD